MGGIHGDPLDALPIEGEPVQLHGLQGPGNSSRRRSPSVGDGSSTARTVPGRPPAPPPTLRWDLAQNAPLRPPVTCPGRLAWRRFAPRAAHADALENRNAETWALGAMICADSPHQAGRHGHR
ncbi:MAG: hypothetical protein U5L11_14520 [Arhodomonas sp.]|nr:hypothetical protein [Arhodomonas sp.]